MQDCIKVSGIRILNNGRVYFFLSISKCTGSGELAETPGKVVYGYIALLKGSAKLENFIFHVDPRVKYASNFFVAVS